MPPTFCKVSRTPPSTGWIPATQQDSVRWEEWRISSLPGSLAKLHWPGVSRAALGVAQPRTGRHAYLNCRRRLKKTNVKPSPAPKRCQFPVVHGRNAHGFTGVAGIRARHYTPRRTYLGTRNALGCVLEDLSGVEVGANAFTPTTGVNECYGTRSCGREQFQIEAPGRASRPVISKRKRPGRGRKLTAEKVAKCSTFHSVSTQRAV